MRRPQGYASVVDPGAQGQVKECDTFTCAHCQRVVFVPPRTAPSDLGGWCSCCAAPICPRCAGGTCTPFMKKLDEYERRNRFAQEVGLVLV